SLASHSRPAGPRQARPDCRWAASSLTKYGGKRGRNTPGWARTNNLRFRRPPLYPMELRVRAGIQYVSGKAVDVQLPADLTRPPTLGHVKRSLQQGRAATFDHRFCVGTAALLVIP